MSDAKARRVSSPGEPASPREPSPPLEGGVPTYVSPITSIEQQVGAHVIRALQHEGAAGVVTVVRAEPGGGQHILSIPLGEDVLESVEELIASVQESSQLREVPCIGFHCARRTPPAKPIKEPPA